MTTAKDIEAIYESSIARPFPYRDCQLLAGLQNQPTEDLIPELDWYFASVAGYSSSATKLGNRSSEQLRAAEEFLSKGFFEHFPALQNYYPLIDSGRTPDLYKQLETVETLRLGLLELLSQLKSQQRQRG